MKSNFSKRIFAILLTVAMILTLVPTAFAFDDVEEGKYYTEAVDWAVSYGITNGISETEFGPNNSCTRGQVVTFLWRAYNKPAPTQKEHPFTDVSEGAYYYDAMLWAVEKGITKGTSDTTFNPGGVCTRGQVVTFLWRAEGEPAAESRECAFTDVNESGYYYEAMLWAVENGITKGTSDTTFNPNGECTRGQVVTFLNRDRAPQLGDLSGKTVILHTNDTHGALLGFAQVAGVKKEIEAAGAKVILVDAGDFSQGTTYVSTNKGAAAIEAMNAAGYDYATLGNHEFDYGYDQLKTNLEGANFEVLCADVLLKENGEPAFTPYAIKEVDGVKIGFFGMETPETYTKVHPAHVQDVYFPQGEELYACAQAQVDALKAEGADLIIGIVHLGVDGESIPNRSIDLYNNVEGIDFLIDGHSHTVMTEGPDGEPIQSTGTKASKTSLMNVGLIQIDNETKAIEENGLISLSDLPPLAEPAAVAQAIMNNVDAEYGAKFAESKVELNGDKAPGNRNMETNLGDLITDSMLWGVLKDMDPETLGVPEENVLAITNGGGIRAWIHAGDVTKNDINTVLPFGNTVAVVYVKGAELLEALEASTYSTPGAVGGFPQVSGIKYTIDTGKEFDQGEQYPDSTYYAPASIKRVTIDEINGQPFDPEATYAVVTNNFCSAGGDTYYAFKAASAQFDTGLPMDEVLMEYITEELKGVIDAPYAEPQGRIIIKEPAAPSDDFVLSGEIKDGDEVVIYNAGHGLAIQNETDNDWYLLGVEPEIDNENHKVIDPTDDIIWTVGIDGENYTFSNGDNMIVCWPSGTYLELTNKADYEGGVKEWKLKEADKNTYSYYIYNATLSGQYGPGWLEFYTKNDNTKLSCYSTGENRLDLANFGFQFYVKGAEYVEPGPGPGPGPSEGDFVLAEPENGDEVVIYNAGHGLAIKNETDNDWYLLGSEVTVDETAHKISDPAADIVWKVASDGNGMYRFTNGDNAITCYVSGTYLELTNKADYEGGVNDWALVEADASTYSYYIKNWSISGQYGPGWLEFYTKNDNTKLSCYSTGEDRLSLENFGFQFYVKGAEYVEPGPGPGPGPGEDKVFVKVTEAPEDWSGTYVIAREKDEATAYVFDGQNDANENFVEAPLADGKITASTANAIVIEKSGEGYTFKATAGYLDGKVYQGALSNGLYFENEPKVGTIDWVDGLPVITSAAGTVFRFNNKTYTDASYLWFRFFKPDSSVTSDANTYVELYRLDDGETPPPACVHEWGDWVVDPEPTCTEAGLQTRTCALCGKVETEELPALGHIDEDEDGKCDVCGEDMPEAEEFVLTNVIADGDKVIIYHPASGMAVSNADLSESQPNYRAGVAVTPDGDKIVDPDPSIVWTVSEGGACFVFTDADGKQLSCSANNLLLDGEYAAWRIEAGGIEGTVNIINDGAPVGSGGDPRAMEWYANYSEFSCYYLTATNEAFALQLFVLDGEVTPVCEHDWVAGDVDPADCTNPEITHYTCSICSAEKTEETAPALGHSWGDWTVNPAPTCTETGSQSRTCSVCSEVETEEIPALGHKDEDEDGKCDTCGIDMSEVPEYVYVLGRGVADGDELAIYYPAAGLALTNELTGDAPKQKLTGVEVTVADDILTLDAEGKTAIYTVEKDDPADANFYLKNADGLYLTSEDAGNGVKLVETATEYSLWYLELKDDEAGTLFIRSTNAAFNGNKNQALEYYNGFTTYGWKDTDPYIFQIYLKTDKSTLHEHDWVAGDVDAADCTHQEITHYTCSICSAEKTEVTGEALGHDWGDEGVITPATCTENGKVTYTCSRCSETFDKVIYAEGHVDVDPEDGKCDVCGADMPEVGDNEFVLFTGELEEGDYLIVYNGKALKASNTANANRLDYAEVTEGDSIVCEDVTLIFHIAKDGDYWTIYNVDANAYVGSNGTKNQAKMIVGGTDNSLWTATMSEGKFEFVNKANAAAGVNANLRNNGTYGFACYSTATGGALTLYKLG